MCGAVRFEVTLPSRFCAHCHCNNCRRAHGVAFVTWAGFPDGQFRVTHGDALLTRYRTDTDATRTFCSRCGSTLFFSSPRWPGETHVALANISEEIDRRPRAHVYVDHRAPWYEITDTLAQYGGKTGTEKKKLTN